MAAAEERTKRRHRGLPAGVRARRWVSAPPSSSPWMAPCFRARAHEPRRRAAERPVPRPDEAGCAGLSRTMAAGCGTVQVSTLRPLL